MSGTIITIIILLKLPKSYSQSTALILLLNNNNNDDNGNNTNTYYGPGLAPSASQYPPHCPKESRRHIVYVPPSGCPAYVSSCLLLLHKTPCGRQSSSLCPDASCPLDPRSAATLLSIGPHFPGPSHFPGLLRDLPGFPERGNDPLPWSSGCAAGSPGLSANVLMATEWCPSAPGSDLGVQQPLPAHICSSARAACLTLSSYLRGLLFTCPNLSSPGEKILEEGPTPALESGCIPPARNSAQHGLCLTECSDPLNGWGRCSPCLSLKTQAVCLLEMVQGDRATCLGASWFCHLGSM